MTNTNVMQKFSEDAMWQIFLQPKILSQNATNKIFVTTFDEFAMMKPLIKGKQIYVHFHI